MKLLKKLFGRNARHFLLMSISFILATGLYSCNSNEMSIDTIDSPTSTDDASLLAWQMKKHLNTRSTSFCIAIVTTSSYVDLNMGKNFTINWGDGTTDTDIFKHSYTDGELAHTIFVYGDETTVTSLRIERQGVIYIDISKCTNLKSLYLNNNRITNIDLSQNINLEFIELWDNKLHSLDVSNIKHLKEIIISTNPISELDLSMHTDLTAIVIDDTNINTLDASLFPKLEILIISNTQISQIDLSKNPELTNFFGSSCPISKLDFSNNPKLYDCICDSTNITELDLSKHTEIGNLTCSKCQISNIKLSNSLRLFFTFDIRNNPIEQDQRKMYTLAMALPNKGSSRGYFYTQTPYIDQIEPLLSEYNWTIYQ